jgi:hypothetical protein
LDQDTIINIRCEWGVINENISFFL